MKNIVLLFVVAFAFCPMAIASDIAISTQANWWSQTAADREMQEIFNNVASVSVELFPATEQDALADWVANHTGDGASDLLILCGVCPDSIYSAGNTQPDGSLAELFLDDGNCIINTGDWIFYIGSAGTNGTAGLPNIMDISSMEMWDDNTSVTVTAEGQQYTPSLTNFQTDRAIHIDALGGDWYAELILALADDGNRAEPCILHNSVTGGRIGVFFQTASQDNDPRGEVISEWINNWYLKYVASANPFVRRPNPADGAVLTQTWASYSWQPGDFAASHDVYFGDNFDDVNDGTRDSETFRGNQALNSTYGVAGFTGYPYPEGLVPGTTYYWRIDEVNEADPNSPWKGKVWSFTIIPLKAHEPVPGDGSRFIVDYQNLTLRWTPGLGAKLHTIYFGDDYDTVANATVGTSLVATSYKPGMLELEKTYYWRVDENDGFKTYMGDVWSFKTLPDITVQDPNLLCWWKLDEGQGTNVLDWSGYGHHGTCLGGPQWVAGYDGGALDLDGVVDYVDFGNPPNLPSGYAERSMCGWGRTDTVAGGWAWIASYGTGGAAAGNAMCIGRNADTLMGVGMYDDIPVYNFWEVGDWHHICLTYDGATAKLYADGLELVSSARDWNLVRNNAYIGRQCFHTGENWGGTVDDVRIYNKVLTPDEIKKVMLGDPMLAWNASPANGSIPDIHAALPLSWSPGDEAIEHDVYFGTDIDAVTDADTSTDGVYRGRLSATSYTPPEGIEWGGGPYFWRVDEYNNDGTISKGKVWSFTVADYISIDDFEDYDVGNNEIWWVWIDGLGYPVHPTLPPHPGNGTGSIVGDETTLSYMEETIVHDGSQSMPFSYDNNQPGYAKYSEVEMTLTSRRDWTEQDVVELSLWFRGYPASVGSFVEGPVGTYTITASGADIWNVDGVEADEFHFAYKMLSGPGSIVAKIESVDNTDPWAKAGVMIRETLDPDSAHAFACITPGNGVAAQGRYETGGASFNWNQGGVTAPHWVKLERDVAGNYTVSHSTNGSSWQPVEGTTTQNIPMSANVYIGLALTAHDVTSTCQAIFSNVTITGSVGPQWAHQDIGIFSNDAEPLYVAVSNSTGTPAIVVHDDPAAAQIDTWTEWVIPLQAFGDQGIVLTDVDRIAIGLGTQGNVTIPGGSGKVFIDDIRLYRSRNVP